MRKLFLICLGAIMLLSTANANPKPVKHSHNGKQHTHILPNNGVGNHNHKGSHNNSRAYSNKKVLHNHSGKKHSHVLPKGQRNHQHGSAKQNRPVSNRKVSHSHNGKKHSHALPNGQRNHQHGSTKLNKIHKVASVKNSGNDSVEIHQIKFPHSHHSRKHSHFLSQNRPKVRGDGYTRNCDEHELGGPVCLDWDHNHYAHEPDYKPQVRIYTQLVGGNNLNGAKYLGGMIWQDQPFNQRAKVVNFAGASQYCANLVHLGVAQWKLPTLQDSIRLYEDKWEKLSHTVNLDSNGTSYFTRTFGCSNPHNIRAFSISKEQCVWGVDLGSYSPINEQTRESDNLESVRCVLDPNIYRKHKSGGITRVKNERTREKFYPAIPNEVERLISGNTLFLKSPDFCPEGSRNKSCLAISLIKENKREGVNIFPAKKRVVKKRWGHNTMSLRHYGFNMGIITLAKDSKSHPFNRHVKINSTGTKMKITKPGTNTVYEIAIQKGISNKYLELANSENFAQIDTTGRKTLGQLLVGSVVESVGKAMREGAQSSSPASSYCFSLKNEATKNLCLGLSKRDSNYCFSSGLSKSEKNICLGVSKQKESYCFSSGMNDEDKNFCLGLSKRDSNYCFSSFLSKSKQNICLGRSKQQESYCFYPGMSDDNRNFCLAILK